MPCALTPHVAYLLRRQKCWFRNRISLRWHENNALCIKKFSMNHPMVGARLQDSTCAFTVWAPFKKKVEVYLPDSDALHPMTKNAFGYWTANLDGVVANTPYLFKLDADKQLPDPASRAQPEGVHGPSTVVSSEYAWTDYQWTGLPLGEMVMYELHVGAFTASRNFDGVISKLPYLRKLGVNTIELMPVAQFPGDRNWGYDGVYPFAVQSSYGGAAGLKRLVDAAHGEGLAVILDVVYNHQGPEGNYLAEYGPYFTDKYKTGWGQAINYDDAWCDGVRNFYWQNAVMWLDEFHLDGLRLDAVHAIWDFSARNFIEELAGRVRKLERESGRKKVLIAEFDLNNPRYIQRREQGGYDLDGQWIDEYHHALHSLITGEVDGYYEDFGHIDHLARSLQDSYVYTGQYSAHRKKLFGRKAEGTTHDQFVVFVQNHDQIGNRMLGDRLSRLVSVEGLKLAAASYLLSPYVPMLFMGEEYGEQNPFQYFISHTDKKLVELVRNGRKEEFSYFKWEGEVPDPQSEDTFRQCMLSWTVDDGGDAQRLFSYYQHLIQFRKSRPAMRSVKRNTLKVMTASDNIICFNRTSAEDSVTIVLNFNKQQLTFVFPSPQNHKKIFDSASREWGGPAAFSHDVVTPGESVQLYPLSALIFENH